MSHTIKNSTSSFSIKTEFDLKSDSPQTLSDKTSDIAAKNLNPHKEQTQGALVGRAKAKNSIETDKIHTSASCTGSCLVAASAEAARDDYHYTRKPSAEDSSPKSTNPTLDIQAFTTILENKTKPQLGKIINLLNQSNTDTFHCLSAYKEKITSYVKKNINSIKDIDTRDFILLLKLINDVQVDDTSLIKNIFTACNDQQYLNDYCSFSEIFQIVDILYSINSARYTLDPYVFINDLQSKTSSEGSVNAEDVHNIAKTLQLITNQSKRVFNTKLIKKGFFVIFNIFKKIEKSNIEISKETYCILCNMMPLYIFDRTKHDPIYRSFSHSFADSNLSPFIEKYKDTFYNADLIDQLNQLNLHTKTNQLESEFIDKISDLLGIMLESIDIPNVSNICTVLKFLKLQKVNNEELLKKTYEITTDKGFLAECTLDHLLNITDSLVHMAQLENVELVVLAKELLDRMSEEKAAQRDFHENHTKVCMIIQKIATFYAVKFNALQTRDPTTSDASDQLTIFQSLLEMERPIKKCIEDILIRYNEFLITNRINPNSLDIPQQKQIAQTQAYFRTLPLQFTFPGLVNRETNISLSQDTVFQSIKKIMSKVQVLEEFAFDEHFAYHSPDIYSMDQNLVVEFDGPHHFEEPSNAGELVSNASTILRDEILKRGSIYIREHYKYLNERFKENKLQVNQIEELDSLRKLIKTDDDNPYKILIISFEDLNGKKVPEMKAFIEEKLNELGIAIDL